MIKLASIQQIEKGKWRAQTYKNGIRKSFSGKSKKEVEKKVRDWENDIDNYGRELEKTTMDVQKLVYDHLFLNVKLQVSLGTFERYMSLYNTHVKNSSIANRNIKHIMQAELQAYFNSKNDKSIKSLSMLKFILAQAFDFAVSNHIIRVNPMSGISLPKSNYESRNLQVLTLSEQKSYMKLATDSYYNTLFVVALNTGMRVGELIALKWENVDLDQGLIRVRETSRLVKEYNDQGEGIDKVVTKEPKTKAGNRDIPIHSGLRNMLKKFKLKSGAFDTGCVFTNKHGAQVSYDSIAKAHKLICEKAQIRNVTFHCLRHTFATRLIEQGVDAKTVSLLLGHTDIKITLNLYTHSTDDTKKTAIEKLYKAISTL